MSALRRCGPFITVGYASGVIPRIPLNLVLVKAIHVLGFQLQDVAADSVRSNHSPKLHSSSKSPSEGLLEHSFADHGA